MTKIWPKINLEKTTLLFLPGLIIFLPLSSWLVSLTGIVNIALIRDILIIILFLLVVLQKRGRIFTSRLSLFTIALVVFGLLSFFWREANVLQWLRGWRFAFMPLLLLLAVINLDLSKQGQAYLKKIILYAASAIAAIAIAEYFGLRMPLVSSLTGQGGLTASHFVGESDIYRLQSILAGPNALGLFMLVAIFVALQWQRSIGKLLVIIFLIVLFMTFSRSALLGALAGLSVFLFGLARDKFGLKKTLAAFAVVMITLTACFFLVSKSPNSHINNLITHSSSSSLRLEQYRRVWDTRSIIGLFGLGSGSAGPSSQNRFDGGPNRWSENTYLEFYEEYGLLGLMLLLGLLWRIGAAMIKTRDLISQSLFVGFLTAGLFINFYTGQVAIYYFILVVALAISRGAPALNK